MAHQTLYLECYSGISGDMMLGALLDLGADQEGLMQMLERLPIEGYQIRQGRIRKQGIDAGYFHVDLKEEDCHVHYGEQMNSLEVHPVAEESHNYKENHGYTKGHDHGESHCHGEGHCHGSHSGSGYTHSHPHIHRNLADVMAIIQAAEVAEPVKKLSARIFEIVAQAEAKAHGVPVEKVHFHEVGAVDSIIDVLGTAYCIWSLGVEDVYLSNLYEGQGHVRCAHGMLPVPVPAVRNIAEAHGLPMTITETHGEMVTPTGAAIAAALWNGKKLPAGVQMIKTGIGAGEKDFPHANILRASLVELEEQTKVVEESDLWILETNMDDVTGEALGYTMEKLMGAGARDTYYSSIFMKKGRPAYLLRVICDVADIEKLETIIFTHTTTIGIRRYPIQRHVLAREIILVDTEWGQVRVKKCVLDHGVRMYPEYEDVRRVCEETGIGFTDVYQKIKAKADAFA